MREAARVQVLERWTSKALADPLVKEAAILAAAQHPHILRYLVRPRSAQAAPPCCLAAGVVVIC